MIGRFFLTGDEGKMTDLLTATYKVPIFGTSEKPEISFDPKVNTLPEDYPYFVLIDNELTIRNYYNINEEASMNRLVEHLAIILPRERREKAEHRPEKEK